MHARPVGERRAGNDDGTEQLGPDGREHHDRPSRLAVADHRRFAVSERMERNHALQESGLRMGDVFNRLAGDRIG